MKNEEERHKARVSQLNKIGEIMRLPLQLAKGLLAKVPLEG